MASQAIYAANIVVEMEKGRIKWMGTPSELTVSSYLALPSIDKLSCSSEVEVEVEEKESIFTSEAKEEVQEQDCLHILEVVQETVESEARKEGRVEPVVYKLVTEETLILSLMKLNVPDVSSLLFPTETMQHLLVGSLQA